MATFPTTDAANRPLGTPKPDMPCICAGKCGCR